VSDKHDQEELQEQVSELASIMREFGLKSAQLSGDDWSVAFAKEAPNKGGILMGAAVSAAPGESSADAAPRTPRAPQEPAAPKGTAISSPMMGVFYSSPSPGSPQFFKEGDMVNAGDVVGLIEAMKVFNEIVTTVSGTVLKVVTTNGALVQPGEPLVLVG